MKAYLSKSLVFVLLVLIFLPLAVNAVELTNPLVHSNFWDLLKAIVRFLMLIAVPITAIIIVISGYYFVTSMGDPEKIRTAKKMVIFALIGLVIILSSWAMIGNIIKSIFFTK